MMRYIKLWWRHRKNAPCLIMKNGNVIKLTSSSSGNCRGNRAKVFDIWLDELGCFMHHDGNKPEGERNSYFILDENDEFIWFDIKEDD